MMAAAMVKGLKGEAPAGQLADPRRHDESEDDADQAAEERQVQRLDEELLEDVASAGADRLADADLAGPLGDRDQHDVHDPDAADDQRDGGDAAEEQGQRRADRRCRHRQLGRGDDGEVVGVGGGRSCRSRRSAVISSLVSVIPPASLALTPIVGTLRRRRDTSAPPRSYRSCPGVRVEEPGPALPGRCL